jgi:hypothetical protein
MIDLVHLLGSLVDANGEILVEGACDSAPDASSAAGIKRVSNVDFSLEGHKSAMTVETLRHEGDKAFLTWTDVNF